MSNKGMERRDFLKKTTTAAVGISIASTTLAGSKNKKKLSSITTPA